jgi:DNA-nicking Smr family endonuclease
MGKSVLRSSLPQWLEALPCALQIRDIRFAALMHGGEGAFYVMLKKRKD